MIIKIFFVVCGWVLFGCAINYLIDSSWSQMSQILCVVGLFWVNVFNTYTLVLSDFLEKIEGANLNDDDKKEA